MIDQMRIRLNGEWWNLKFANLDHTDGDGYCDPPTTKRRRIWIHDELKNRRQLEILLHEMLHAVDWHKDENSFIAPVARDIAKVLWKLGYRRSVESGEGKTENGATG